MYTYFIKPRTGTKEVDEEDLDEPTSLQIERELSKLVPGSRVFDTASRKSEPETEGAVRFILESFCLYLTNISLIWRYYHYRRNSLVFYGVSSIFQLFHVNLYYML